jgi:FkbM family methyltransferase
MANFYSQHGEDYLLDLMFPDTKDGFFVEIGCIDGRRFSNTLYFEEKGWKGLCVEAHPDYIPFLKQNRPNSIICHYAVGEKDEDDVIFYSNDRGSLSTLDKTQEARWKKQYAEYFHGFVEKHVAKRTLNSIFKEQQVGHINILSLDIEGYEIPALQGLDLRVYQPDVLVIETDGDDQKNRQNEILSAAGYFSATSLYGNIFYVRDQKLAAKVQNIAATVPLVQSRHPLDAGDDLIIQAKIDTRLKKPFWKRPFSK